MAYFFSGAVLAFFLFLGTGCSQMELSRAFRGEFTAQKNNKVIGEYCTSCHIHKEFDSSNHVVEVRSEYRRRAFRRTTECRACHYLEKQWIHNEVLRKTRRPHQVNRETVKKFKKGYLKIPNKT